MKYRTLSPGDVAKSKTAEHPESGMASELRTLVELSRTSGEPGRDLVILAEGNTSIRPNCSA